MFTLLHTNDFHNHLHPGQADYLRRLREAVGKAGLLLDAGDAVASGNLTFRPGGEPILQTMTAVGYDAMTVGNREFHVTRMGFHCKVGMAAFPVLCANVRRSAASASDSLVDPPVVSHIERTLVQGNGRQLRIVIFGLTVPMITERMLSRKVSAYIFENPIAAAARLVPALHAQYSPDLLVALTHIGFSQDCKLAETVMGIDLIIGGHSHTTVENGKRAGDTLIVQTGCFGHYIGRVDIVFAAPDQQPEVSSASRTRPDMRACLLPLPQQPGADEMAAQIARLSHPLPAQETTVHT